MRRAVKACLTVLLLGAASLSVAQSVSPKRKAWGVVLDDLTGGPIVGARVSLYQQKEAAADARGHGNVCINYCSPSAAEAGTLAITDPAGRFEFDVAARPFLLDADRNGYESGSADVSGNTEESFSNIVLRLTPMRAVTASVRGRIHDVRTGRPVPDVEVTLFRRGFNRDGESEPVEISKSRTNDLGEYRLYWIEPGRYYLGVEEGENDSTTNRNVISVPYVWAFFPGVQEVGRASVLDLKAGSDVVGIDFGLVRQRLFRIRGRVVDSRTNEVPEEAIRIRATVEGRNPSKSFSSQTDRSGAFEMASLPSDRYKVTADPMRQKEDSSSASATLVIADSDIDGLVLTLASEPPADSEPPISISGRIRLEGQPKADWILEGSVGIGFYGHDGSYAHAEADGTFTLTGPPPGNLRVRTYWMPDGFYLKQANIDGQDALGRALSFADGREMEIVISSRVGLLEGVARNGEGKPFPEAHVVLVPEARDRPELFLAATADKDGRFGLAVIPPGRYRLFAWDTVEHYEYFDPEVMQRFEERGIPVEIGETSKQTLDVRVFSLEEAPETP